MYAKKRPFKRTANYIISMDKNMKDRGSDSCVGKLRANPEGDKYILYDNGENFNKVHRYALDKIRNEHGAFVYRYEPCNVGNIRKMIIVLPILVQSSASHINGPENIYPIAYDPSGNKVVMT